MLSCVEYTACNYCFSAFIVISVKKNSHHVMFDAFAEQWPIHLTFSLEWVEQILNWVGSTLI